MALPPDVLLAHLAAESDRLADDAGAAGIDTAVPTCPGWTVRDLLEHCTAGDRWVHDIVTSGGEKRMPSLPADAPADGPALVEYFRAGARALVDVLTAADPDAASWTISRADRTVGFWIRRRAQETTVHRVDAEAAAAAPTPIDPALASDGVDEYLTRFLGTGEGLAGIGGSLHFHCTDVDGEWLIVPGPSGLTVTREHAKGDVAARGRAEDLLLLIWGRRGLDAVDVFGDAELLERFLAALRP